jgi:CubicO group peptidase (beta-lactamase class C family)
VPSFVAYHNVSADQHQQRVNELTPQGFRPIALGVSGDPADARYAAVWVQRTGPAWQAVHHIDAGEYQRWFTAFVAQGYAPVLVDATGPAANATFVALFEQGVTRPWFARHDLRWDPVTNPDTITHENQRAFNEGFIPRALAVYGTPADRRFAGVWIKNDAPTPWSWWFADRDTHQRIFTAEMQAGVRPTSMSVAPDWWQLSVFRDDRVGAWSARHGITADEYQVEFNVRVAAGMMPVVVQAGGSGADARYSSVFVANEFPAARRFQTTGTAAPTLIGVDLVIAQFMREHAIRAGALAAVRGDTTLVHRGYTWSEDLSSPTQPDSPFRIASLTKIFTIAAIERLIAMGRLQWSTRAFPLLGLTHALLADQHPDPSIDTITVDHLVKHVSGIKHVRVAVGGGVREFEPLDDLRAVAARLGRTVTPTRDDLVRYVYGEALDFPPGLAPNPDSQYSNMGYVVLTSVIEAASGRGYLDFLRAEVLAPMGLRDLWLGATALSGRRAGEVFYDHPGADLSVLQPTANVREPNAYGGKYSLEGTEGTGAIVSTALTVARFITQHAVWGTGGRLTTGRARRYGILDGTAASAESLHSGIDYTVIFNRRITDHEHDDITDRIKAFLDAHA